MSAILCIETATRVCSVAICKEGNVISKREISGEYSHAEKLTLFIREVSEETGIMLGQLDAVAVSRGPGSFTGLRIGVSTAKGLCYALDKPLISVGTLQSMAYGMAEICNSNSTGRKDILFCPMIDARRMEVYTALYDGENNEIIPPAAEIIAASSFSEYFKKHTLCFAGDGAEKCKELFAGQPRAVFLDTMLPSACHMASLADHAFNAGRFEDVASFEPYYLKDFVAGKPKVKGLK